MFIFSPNLPPSPQRPRASLARGAGQLLPLFVLALGLGPVRAEGIKIVAAENFYGGVAAQIAGPSAQITSILTNPNQDPHEFTSDIATARAVADAAIVIYSGLSYDPRMEKLLATGGQPGRVVIVVAELIGAPAGANPHIWYAPQTMPALGARLAAVLSRLDPTKAAFYQAQAVKFAQSLEPERAQIARIGAEANGLEVSATEPVFGYLASALGLKMLDSDFQLKIMNDAEPSAVETAAIEDHLTRHRAKILFYNRQVTDPTTDRIQQIARRSGVPIVGVTETEPTEAKTYAAWMAQELALVEAALPTARELQTR